MEMMQAAVLENLGKWNFKKVPVPSCMENDVIIQTMRSGVCSTDVVRSMRTGFYCYPIIPGHEFCGVVVEKGKNVTNVDIDERVAIYPLISCGKCRHCQTGLHNLCNNYNYLGSRTDGGYAEFVKCPAENLVKMPKGVTFEEASMTEPASVTFHANKVSSRGNTVLIMGLGPIGLLAAQWAKIFGATNIIGIDRNDHRFRIAKEIGIDTLIDTRNQDVNRVMNEATYGEGADVVFECSGSDELQSQAILSAAKRGKIIMLGNPNRNFVIDTNAYSCILRKELTLRGSWNSLISTNEWSDVLNAMKEKKLNTTPLISHGFHISEARNVIEDMHFKRFEFSKVCFYF